MRFIPLLFIIFLSWSIPVQGQDNNYRAGYEKADPVPKHSPLSLDEKVNTHQAFLEKAIQNNDSLKQLFSFLYLFTDYAKAADYAEASNYLLKAEALAKASNKAHWQGWVSHRKGILSLLLKNFDESLEHYKKAAQLCVEAGDSICFAESLEQIGAVYGQLKKFDKAESYFNQAILLFEKIGEEAQFGPTYNNFGIFLALQNRASEAIPYYKDAINIFQKHSRHKEEGQALNNLADAYRRMNWDDLAIKTYDQCILLNREHNLQGNLITNYLGLYEFYKEKEDYETADEYLIEYYELRDSLIGASTQEKIADLEIKYESQQKELALQKSKADLLLVKQKLNSRNLIFLSVLLLIAFWIWRWRWQIRQVKRALIENQENLAKVTDILLKKNRRLLEMEEVITQQPNLLQTNDGLTNQDNLFEQRILTDEDWNDFKIYFEKSYPGYLMRVRSNFTDISEAEGRLFLFIKLNLTRKEAAAILGISSDSVKKTRYRLRKRLQLDKESSLEDFIQAF